MHLDPVAICWVNFNHGLTKRCRHDTSHDTLVALGNRLANRQLIITELGAAGPYMNEWKNNAWLRECWDWNQLAWRLRTAWTRNMGQCPTWWPPCQNIGGTLCSTPQFGWRPLLECRAVTLPRRKTHWNYLGCPKLTKRSQPLVGRSSPYCEDTWRRNCCLTSIFWLSMRALVAKI